MRRVVVLLALVGCGIDRRPMIELDASGGVDVTLLPDGGMRDSNDSVSLEPDAMIAIDAGVPSVPPLAVIVGYGGRRARSLDGVTWTHFVQIDPNGGEDENLLRGVGYGNGKFVAVGGSGNGLIMTSTDGITWSSPSRSLDHWLGNVALLGTKFIAAGGNGLRVRSIDNAATWQVSGGYQAIHYRDVASSGSIAVAVGHNYDTTPTVGIIASTTDGITWTERKRGGQSLDRVVFGKGVFVAAGKAGGIVRSTNGTTWTSIALEASGTVKLTFTGTEFIATVGASYHRSTDGLQWTESSSTRSVDGFIAGRYLSLNWPATIHASQNLTSWTQVFAPGGSGFTRVVVGNRPQ